MSPTDLFYVDTLSYHSYRLEDVSQHHSHRGTGKVRYYIKQMVFRLSRYLFSGEDLIMVIDFLTRFVRKANIQEMSEDDALTALPSFFKGCA